MGSKVAKSPPCGTMLENFLGFFWGFLKLDLGYFDPSYLATLFCLHCVRRCVRRRCVRRIG